MKNLVSCQWLKEHLNDDNLVLFDAGMPAPGSKEAYRPEAVIPGALRFDISSALADATSGLPNTMCGDAQFEQRMREAGVDQDSLVVIYDDKGLFSAARGWWMFKSMGFDNVKVLNGGLPKWRECGFAVTEHYATPPGSGDFKAVCSACCFIDVNAVLAAIDNPMVQLIDARARARFDGTVAEPRAGMRAGHIPGAKCLPYTELLESGEVKEREQLKACFEEIVGDNVAHLQFSCGSGVTACILALAADECGYPNLCVYDGSWSEWGARQDLPIET